MKILHTSDWHLGKKLNLYSRFQEQNDVLNEICDIANQEKVDAVIIAGDLYDTVNPSIEAIELFYRTLKKLSNNAKRPVIAIAGNHDSPDRIEAPDPLARENGIIFSGYPYSQIRLFNLNTGLQIINTAPGFIEIKLPDVDYNLRLLLTPYANELRLREFLGNNENDKLNELRILLSEHWKNLANNYCDNNGVNILAAHLYFTKRGGKAEPEPEEEKSIITVGGAQSVYTDLIPHNIQYTALGHLHRFHNVSDNNFPVYYSGSILSYSFSDAEQEKYVSIVDVKPGTQPSVNKIKLNKGKMLFRKKFDSIETAVEWLTENPNTLVELTIVTDTFLTGIQKKQLYNAHDGIITIIPEITNPEILSSIYKSEIDLSLNTTELFKNYFKYKNNGQEPNEDILNIFDEILTKSR